MDNSLSARRLLFYALKDDADGKRLLAVVAAAIQDGNLEIYSTLKSFAQRLRAPGLTNLVAIMLAASSDELQEQVGLRDLLADVPVVLVVPDQDEATIQRAHQLTPRFISLKNSDFSALAKVLRKMLEPGV